MTGSALRTKARMATSDALYFRQEAQRLSREGKDLAAQIAENTSKAFRTMALQALADAEVVT